MSVLPLSQLTNWTLNDRDSDIRGRPLFDESGRHLGKVTELLIDTDTERIGAVRNETGSFFPAELLEIFSSGVIVGESASASPVAGAPDWTSTRHCRPALDDCPSKASEPAFQELRRARIEAVDGRIGMMKDIYFDDHYWTIRYLVVDISKWLFGRKVLIAPEAITRIDRHAGSIYLNLTREQIRRSPSWDSEPPVSRQYEAALKQYYGWGAVTVPTSPALGAPFIAGTPYVPAPHEYPGLRLTESPEEYDDRLRSMKEVSGYIVEAADATIGTIRDFMLQSNGARVVSLLVDRSDSGATEALLLLSISAVDTIDWPTAKVKLVSDAAGLDRGRMGART